MNKIIPFNKDITFNEKIGEIESIALDDTLKFIEPYTIKGELIVRGCNKYLDVENEFSYPLPVEIAVDSKYDTKKASINIDDFYYEIINDNILRVKIDLILDDLYYKEQEPEKEVREVKDDIDAEVIPIDIEESKINDNQTELEKNTEINITQDLLNENNDEKKDYSIYRVYVYSDNDTLDSILNKYKVTKEELEEINDLTNLKPGVKLVIPSIDE